MEPLSMIVDIWTIERDSGAELATLSGCLSPDELVRADRLRVAEKREAFIYNRAILRQILASYLDLAPSEVSLVTSALGKPLLGEPPGGSQLTFNLSHCLDLALVAVGCGTAVGIDVEAVDDSTNYDALAKQALSPRELAVYQRLSPLERPGAVLRAWTRKEAYLKAVGCGIARPLGHIQVTFLEGEHPRLLVSGDSNDAPADWIFRSWSPRPGWFAAVAAPQADAPLQLQWKAAASLRDRIASPNEPAALVARG